MLDSMPQNIESWAEFWDGQKIFSDLTLKKNMEIFLSKIGPRLRIGSSDRVLDVGCGAGFLEEILQGRVHSIVGLDTSLQYIDQCQQKFKDKSKLEFFPIDKTNYTDFSFLGQRKFSLIIVSTIIQYYASKEDVIKLIESLMSYSEPHTRIIISDFPFEEKLATEVFSQLSRGLRSGYLPETLKTFIKARFSNYYKIRKNRGLLKISKPWLESRLDGLGLKYHFNNDPITVNSGRWHLFIEGYK